MKIALIGLPVYHVGRWMFDDSVNDAGTYYNRSDTIVGPPPVASPTLDASSLLDGIKIVGNSVALDIASLPSAGNS